MFSEEGCHGWRKVPFGSMVKQLFTVFLSKVECLCSIVLGRNVSLSRSRGSLI